MVSSHNRSQYVFYESRYHRSQSRQSKQCDLIDIVCSKINPIGATVISTCVLVAWSFPRKTIALFLFNFPLEYVRFRMELAANHTVIQHIAHIFYNYRN